MVVRLALRLVPMDGQNGGDTGADVLSEEDVYRAVQADYPD